jgi:RNA polymerase sigma factor (TIGR02999 family)
MAGGVFLFCKPLPDGLSLALMNEVTQILSAVEQGDSHAADQLLPLVYEELRKLAAQKMAQERPGQTLDATALVHEVYLRLVVHPWGAAGKKEQSWNSRGHFFAAAAEAMRRILVERARHKKSAKAGGSRDRVELAEVEVVIANAAGEQLLDLDVALDKLAKAEPRKAELVKLRYFAGLSNEQAARALGISPSTADNDWAYARSWLRVELLRQGSAGERGT